MPSPLYFVLGNHDYYYSSIEETRSAISILAPPNTHYLTTSGVITLSEGIALLGHDGWADARNGDYRNTRVELNDFYLIRDFKWLVGRWEHYSLMEKLADEAADYFTQTLPAVARQNRQVFVVTHVPPFQDASCYQGEISPPDSLPFFSNRSVGEVLLSVMKANPHCQLTVLCGHSHAACVYQPAATVEVRTALAKYGSPDIAGVITCD